ncbi:aldolase/citrate lyase family protein [Clostridium sp. chh4-2]|uniref:HpcH/HpaI aldolase family protein n=1 Tax=Clostridium sp. chh4-2 TaxID=2067550 RepID=UPI0015E19E96|nr:aldolase/citrate lyase family protein [Clostridium sp. chh4-2]
MKNLLREKMEAHEQLRGTHVCMSDSSICELIGGLGFDFIWIDMEHSYLSCETVHRHIIAARAANTASLIRLPQDDLTVTKKVLEMGPDAVIFPMITSAGQADKLIRTTLYPPDGDRGFGPMRAIRYGLDDAVEYIDKKSLDLCRFIQIEHKDAVENLEELVQNPFIDGYIFGPNDLSGSIGKLGRMYDPECVALIQKAAGILKHHGKNFGVSLGGCEEGALRFWKELGANILSSGTDYRYILNGAKAVYNTIKMVQEE